MLTKWQWKILLKLRETDLPETYAQYLFTRITGIPFTNGVAMTVTRIAWSGIFILSLFLVVRPMFRRKISVDFIQRVKS